MTDYTTTKAPGVYIEEIAPTPPIVGVGTSTVAFIGPAMSGPIGKPTLITNWTQFATKFGGYPKAPKTLFYTPYAVHGFFDNGGMVAYMVRVGPGKQASLDLKDRATHDPESTLIITALQEGIAGNNIQVSVNDDPIVNSDKKASVAKAQAEITSTTLNTITLKNASDTQNFRKGDIITIDTPASTSERIQIAGIQADGTITLASKLSKIFGSGTTLRIADLQQGQSSFRITNGEGIEIGSVIQLSEDKTQEAHVVDSFSRDNGFVTLANGLQNVFSLASSAPTVTVTTQEFSLQFSTPTGSSESFNNLSMDPRHSHYFDKVMADKPSKLVTVSLPELPNIHQPPTNQPAIITGINLQQGTDDPLSSIGPQHYNDALTALTARSDVNILCVPDASTSTDIQQAVIDHCGQMRDRFAILDSAPGKSDSDQVIGQRNGLQSDNGYAAIYSPWIRVNDPASATGSGILLIPPSGHIAGIYARSDTNRGVHKAPANEFITGARGLELIRGVSEYDRLNQNNVNALRSFANQAPVVWGARTISGQVTWRYINVRRLFIFVEQSLLAGLRWAVFEPNDKTLWKKLERTITEFLTRVWRSGALFGDKASQAFYVKVDEELNPPEQRELGQVVIEIGIVPVFPAEFVVVRIAMWDGGSQTNEG